MTVYDKVIEPETRWRLKREARAYFANLTRTAPDRKRVLIFAQGRTGSTVLENLLSSTGHFEERGELLGANNERIFAPAAYLNGMARLSSAENFLCHVKIYHLGHDRKVAGAKPVDPGEFLQTLSNDGWSIVHLQRSDKLRHYLSRIIAEKRGGYHKFDDSPEKITITVDRQDMERVLRNRATIDRREKEFLATINHLPLIYEDHLSTSELQAETINTLLDFIGLERRMATTKMKKINSRPLEDVIENYADVQRWAREFKG